MPCFWFRKLLFLELEFFVDQALRQRRERKRSESKKLTRLVKFFDSSQLQIVEQRWSTFYARKPKSVEKTCWNAVGGFLCNHCDCFCWQGRRVVLQSSQGGKGQKSYVLQNWQNCSRTIAVNPQCRELLWTIIVNVHGKSIAHQNSLWRRLQGSPLDFVETCLLNMQCTPAISWQLSWNVVKCLLNAMEKWPATLEQLGWLPWISYHGLPDLEALIYNVYWSFFNTILSASLQLGINISFQICATTWYFDSRDKVTIFHLAFIVLYIIINYIDLWLWRSLVCEEWLKIWDYLFVA